MIVTAQKVVAEAREYDRIQQLMLRYY